MEQRLPLHLGIVALEKGALKSHTHPQLRSPTLLLAVEKSKLFYLIFFFMRIFFRGIFFIKYWNFTSVKNCDQDCMTTIESLKPSRSELLNTKHTKKRDKTNKKRKTLQLQGEIRRMRIIYFTLKKSMRGDLIETFKIIKGISNYGGYFLNIYLRTGNILSRYISKS